MRLSKIKILVSTIFYFGLSTKYVLCQDDRSYDPYSLKNYLNSSIEITDGIVNNLGNTLPTLSEIINAPMQLLAGYPHEWVISVMDEICSFLVQAGSAKTKYKATDTNVEIQLHTTCDTFYYKIFEADQLVENPKFDRSKKVIILSAGYACNPNQSHLVYEMAKAFNCRGDVNFLAYDAAVAIDTLYLWSAFNTKQAGSVLAEFLSRLVEFVPLENVHLIGHSLGAHIVSYAGKYFHLQTDKKISQITGLDPARPCFHEGEELSGLSRGDAQFIDVIHTNPGVFGKREITGDVDFYTNGFDPLVTGCLDSNCSHARSNAFYIETIYPGNENNFLAKRCSSLDKLLHGRCVGKEYAMGYAVDKNLKGTYFLEVEPSPPYGKGGTKEREEANRNCGICGK